MSNICQLLIFATTAYLLPRAVYNLTGTLNMASIRLAHTATEQRCSVRWRRSCKSAPLRWTSAQLSISFSQVWVQNTLACSTIKSLGPLLSARLHQPFHLRSSPCVSMMRSHHHQRSHRRAYLRLNDQIAVTFRCSSAPALQALRPVRIRVQQARLLERSLRHVCYQPRAWHSSASNARSAGRGTR